MHRETATPHNIDASLAASREAFPLSLDRFRDDAIVVLDHSGRVATWNPGAERIQGYTAQEVIGQHFSVFRPDGQAGLDLCELCLRKAAREGRFEDEGWRTRKDGSRFWANEVIAPLEEAGGMLVGFVLVTRPLTERTSGEGTSSASERSASDAANYAICRLDIGGHVVSWNASAERITGYPAQEVIGRNVSLFYPDENAVATGDLEAATRDDGVADEGWRLRKDGSRFWANILIVALRNAREELVGFAKVTRDLTEQHRADAERPRVSDTSDKSTSAAALDGVRVVVVEDEADARELIQLVLERSGAEVLAAASAAEGLKAVEAFSPHVIVSDIGMPHEDGYSFMRRVRGLPDERGGAVAAVALTAYTRDEDRLHAMRAGYNRHLAKPAHPDDLVSTIRDLVKNPRNPAANFATR